jgi:putative tricarboxylic transport membrane protein
VFASALHAVSDVLEGRADAGAISAASAAKALETDALRALAVSAPARLGGLFEGVPTWIEQSVPCVIGQWRGVIGAHGIADEQIAYWERAISAATKSPEWTGELDRYYWAGACMTAVETRAFLDSERDLLRDMLAQLGLLEQTR